MSPTGQLTVRVGLGGLVTALVIAVLAVREGIEAWKGDVESPLELFSEIDDEEVKTDACLL